jgi:hypothetical protein
LISKKSPERKMRRGWIAIALSGLLILAAILVVSIRILHRMPPTAEEMQHKAQREAERALSISRPQIASAVESISGVWQAAQVFYRDKGEWPATVEELEQEAYLQMAQSTKLQWSFSIVGAPPVTITAVSTEQMKGGAGKTVTYNIEDGSWSGYGMPTTGEEEE